MKGEGKSGVQGRSPKKGRCVIAAALETEWREDLGGVFEEEGFEFLFEFVKFTMFLTLPACVGDEGVEGTEEGRQSHGDEAEPQVIPQREFGLLDLVGFDGDVLIFLDNSDRLGLGFDPAQGVVVVTLITTPEGDGDDEVFGGGDIFVEDSRFVKGRHVALDVKGFDLDDGVQDGGVVVEEHQLLEQSERGLEDVVDDGREVIGEVLVVFDFINRLIDGPDVVGAGRFELGIRRLEAVVDAVLTGPDVGAFRFDITETVFDHRGTCRDMGSASRRYDSPLSGEAHSFIINSGDVGKVVHPCLRFVTEDPNVRTAGTSRKAVV